MCAHSLICMRKTNTLSRELMVVLTVNQRGPQNQFTFHLKFNFDHDEDRDLATPVLPSSVDFSNMIFDVFLLRLDIDSPLFHKDCFNFAPK